MRISSCIFKSNATSAAFIPIEYKIFKIKCIENCDPFSIQTSGFHQVCLACRWQTAVILQFRYFLSYFVCRICASLPGSNNRSIQLMKLNTHCSRLRSLLIHMHGKQRKVRLIFLSHEPCSKLSSLQSLNDARFSSAARAR